VTGRLQQRAMASAVGANGAATRSAAAITSTDDDQAVNAHLRAYGEPT
jgi:hypothetical protein